MSDNFEQISTKSGFMKHNGGLLVKKYLKMNSNLKLKSPQIISIELE